MCHSTGKTDTQQTIRKERLASEERNTSLKLQPEESRGVDMKYAGSS